LINNQTDFSTNAKPETIVPNCRKTLEIDNMKFELRYFTGTGNSLKILDTCKDIFIQFNHESTISEINFEETNLNESDILGFCFPVYAFGIPRICRKYLKSINKFNKRQFVSIFVAYLTISNEQSSV